MDNITFAAPVVLPINFSELAMNLAFCVVASFLLRYVYVRKSISLSGKFHIGTVIPILACVTFLVIMVVKSSLALSLGLVGALSVIRFRTPIKEPEELVYLFLAISLGLGYGAGQTFVTTVVFVVILALILSWLSRKTTTHETEFNLHIDWTCADLKIDDIISRISDHVSSAELQKFTSGSNEQSIFMKVNLNDITSIEAIVSRIQEIDKRINCAFYEARPLQ